jgi:uncharacterized membrane protein YphA (DoxX/SURF4 family)
MKTKDILIYFIAFVFISTSIHRFIYKEQRLNESNNYLNLPKYSDILIILFELIIGVLLLINIKYKIIVLKILLVAIIIFSIIIFVNNKEDIMNTYNEVWTFEPKFTNFILHITYIIIILSIIYGQ